MRRWLGIVLLALAGAAAVWEAVVYFKTGDWYLLLFGDAAFQLFPKFLNLAQAVIQRYVSDWLWDPAIQTALLWPAWPVLGGLGLFFLVWSKLRRGR